jgi:hypothetical protein
MGSFSLRQLVQIGRSLGGTCLLASAVYPLRQRWYETQCQSGLTGQRLWQGVSAIRRRRRPAPSTAATLGQVLSSRVAGQMVDLECSNGALHLKVLADDLICFWLQRNRSDGVSFIAVNGKYW